MRARLAPQCARAAAALPRPVVHHQRQHAVCAQSPQSAAGNRDSERGETAAVTGVVPQQARALAAVAPAGPQRRAVRPQQLAREHVQRRGPRARLQRHLRMRAREPVSYMYIRADYYLNRPATSYSQ